MYVKDEDNICLRCENADIYGKCKENGSLEYHTFAVCRYGGKNAGQRRQCKRFIRKKKGASE